jgi:hypothetical protein
LIDGLHDLSIFFFDANFELLLASKASEFFKPQKAIPSPYVIPKKLFKALQSFQNHKTITSN